MESMKLETALRAPFAGRVREVLVAVNTQVEGGTTLLRLEPAGDGAQAEEAPRTRVGLAGLAAAATEAAATRTSPSAAAADALDALRSLVLGYDIDEAAARGCPGPCPRPGPHLPDDDPDVLAGELAIMQIFADLSALSRNRRGPEVEEAQPDGVPEGDSAERAHNPQEYLHAFLRSRDADAEGLPESFRARLRAALSHYGVRDLGAARRPGAGRRAVPDVPRAPAGPRARAGGARPAAVAARHAAGLACPPTIRERVPAHPRAPDHRDPGAPPGRRRPGPARAFRRFDEPVIAAERARGQQEVRAELDRLAPPRPRRPGRASIDDIVATAEPILSVFGEPHLAVMLEVMTRRYYRIRHLTDVPSSTAVDGRCCRRPTATTGATTSSSRPPCTPRRRRRSRASRPRVQSDLRRIVAQLPADCTVLLDLYVTAGQAPDDDPERSAEKIRESAGHAFPHRLDRVAVAVRRAGSRRAVELVHVPPRPGPASPSRTAPCAGCTRWWPSGWGCGG